MSETTTYSLYVIQLPKRCPECKRHRKPGMKCCVYVGYTSKTPEERLEDHLDPPPGYKQWTDVRKCGQGEMRRFLRPRPDLAPKRKYRTPSKARAAERRLMRDLHDQGYTVFGDASVITRLRRG
jgi:hypothetical protein